jgi:predicted component of viral defense system (DUF524 family)
MRELEFDSGRGKIWTQGEGRLGFISKELSVKFAPAHCYAYEWTDYWVRHPEAERLRAGDQWSAVIDDRLFRVRFENRVGLTWLQPFAQGRPVGEALPLEVLSTKFPTPQAHHSILSTLLEDLFARAARLPFDVSAPTGRGVAESLKPPTPLFTLHFLTWYAYELRSAWNFVQAHPHRLLADHPAMVPLAEATEIDADVLIGALRDQDPWVMADGFPLAKAMRGHAPTEVWQRRPEETLDTPENRFVRAFLSEVLSAAERLPDQPWWPKVSPDRRQVVGNTATLLRHAVAYPAFSGVEPMRRYPRSSRVLMRREGYRQMFGLWQLFQKARRPFFGPLEHAIDVRDVATLYEMWVFFVLIDEIVSYLDCSPELKILVSDEAGLGWRSEARFGSRGRLVYNWQRGTYSVPLRPDYLWETKGRPEVVLDAKFRLDRQVLDQHGDDLPEATVRRADLYKMHTYRDALGVRAAVSVFPGDESIFYDEAKGLHERFGLLEVLFANYSGVGAIAMKPDRALERIFDNE